MSFQYDFSREQVAAAVVSGGGTVKGAAKSLGCSWLTARSYIQKYELETELHDAATNIGLLAEETVMGMILAAANDPDYARQIQPTLIFTLKCKRAWIETQNINMTGDLRAPCEIIMNAIEDAIEKRNKTEAATEPGEDTEAAECES